MHQKMRNQMNQHHWINAPFTLINWPAWRIQCNIEQDFFLILPKNFARSNFYSHSKFLFCKRCYHSLICVRTPYKICCRGCHYLHCALNFTFFCKMIEVKKIVIARQTKDDMKTNKKIKPQIARVVWNLIWRALWFVYGQFESLIKFTRATDVDYLCTTLQFWNFWLHCLEFFTILSLKLFLIRRFSRHDLLWRLQLLV